MLTPTAPVPAFRPARQLLGLEALLHGPDEGLPEHDLACCSLQLSSRLVGLSPQLSEEWKKAVRPRHGLPLHFAAKLLSHLSTSTRNLGSDEMCSSTKRRL